MGSTIYWFTITSDWGGCARMKRSIGKRTFENVASELVFINECEKKNKSIADSIFTYCQHEIAQQHERDYYCIRRTMKKRIWISPGFESAMKALIDSASEAAKRYFLQPPS